MLRTMLLAALAVTGAEGAVKLDSSQIPGWDLATRGEGWKVAMQAAPTRDGLRTSLTIAFPSRRPSVAGEYAALSRRSAPRGARISLSPER